MEVVLLIQNARTEPDWRHLARLIETRYPQLDGRLLTAVQQNPNAGQELNYLQQRVLEETLRYSSQNDWADAIPKSRTVLAQTAHWLALIFCALILWKLPSPEKRGLLARISDVSITVTPGDTHLERGSSLVVLARFGGALPAVVELVTSQPPKTPGGATSRIQLVKSLADPIFGGSITEIATNLLYHVEYAGQRTRDFKISIFDYPRLERADVDVTFPDYTGQPAKRIENTHRLSAVEGSRVDLNLQLNKPVVAARLVAKDKDRTVLPLVIETNRPVAALKNFPLQASKIYELQIVDAEGRTNKIPAQFVFDALTNRSPEIKLATPRGDLRPSALEEISFEGTVWDDFGVKNFGLAYTAPGQETRFIELGHGVPANEKRPFQYVLRLEDLGIQPDQLLAWFLWADDLGPDGNLRRTSGDLFFAEVRPFDEVFREGDDSAGGGGQGGQGGQNDKLIELEKKIISATWNLQRQHGGSLPPGRKAPALLDPKSNKPAPEPPSPPKQSSWVMPDPGVQASLENRSRRREEADMITRNPPPHVGGYAVSSQRVPAQPLMFGQIAPLIGLDQKPSATDLDPPRPQTKPGSYPDDALILRDSQAQALEQAEATAGDQRDPRSQALWSAAVKEMEKALSRLNQATNSPAALAGALAAEQAAYEALLKLQEHEYQVVRNRQNRAQGGGAKNERMQRQLEQMDMTQSENRYETQRQAQQPKDNQVREQLQVMNRLQELARRQQDLNDRLKELQTALQQARTEEEREEIRRRLKRLQEEEQQMLADVDEVRQRMDRPENQSRMADERRQLEQTREDVQRAAEASSKGEASQALAAGTRAQRQLQQLRDQMRKENSNQFADDLRQMRSDARDLARQQEDILKKLEPESTTSKGLKPLSDAPERDQMIKQLAQQKQRMTNLVEHATQISQQAEDAEPLLSRQLYDTLRKFSQENLKNVRETQEELLSRRLMTEGLSEQLKQSTEHDGAKLLDVASEMLRHDFRRQASDTIQRTRGTIDELKTGVERAAESVLGDDTEALRLAQKELDQLTEQLQREMAQAEANSGATNGTESSDSQGKARQVKAGATAGKETADNQPGKNQEQTKESGDTSGQRPQQQASGEQSVPGSAGQQQGEGEADSKPGGQTNGEQASEQAGNQPGDKPGQRAQRGSANRGGGSNAGGAGGEFLRNFDRLLNDDTHTYGGPLTGANFGPWSDRLRDIEEVLEFPDLRNQVATSRERARLMRQDFKREHKKPDWAVVRLQVMAPLLEVRAGIADELARRDSTDALAPIDRDPVPSRYSTLVRRYYEELGKDKAPAAQK